MPLTQLILNGFKSFAEKTTIKFDRGITGIVGPNGSGKSNITEAIRWVMGEASAKSLRGNNMKDVIFAGSALREPLNHAEVTMLFDNKERFLSLNADQVAVTRRILRDGENTYFINQQAVRLKDIRSLFIDSGISQHSLAIISQGRVDEILNSQPQARRGIFEEAAGILHFKQQKELAVSQLDQTQDNLIRINDLVKELSMRLEPLQEQSSLAKEYQFQQQKFAQKFQTLLAFEIQTLNAQQIKVKTENDQNQRLLDKLDREVKQSQMQLSEKRKTSQILTRQKDDKQAQLLKLTQSLSQMNTRLEVAAQSDQYDHATQTEYESQQEQLQQQKNEVIKAQAAVVHQISHLQAQIKVLSDQQTSLREKVANGSQSITEKIDALRETYIQTLQDQTSANNQTVYLKVQIQRLKDQDHTESQSIKIQLKTAEASWQMLRLQGQAYQDQVKHTQQLLTRCQASFSQNETDWQNLQGKLAKTKETLDRVSAQKEALTRLQARHEGYYYGVRYILDHLSNYAGVIGAVGDLLVFPLNLQAALSTALGSGVQDLITKNRQSAKQAIQQLKMAQKGRATFLPLDGLSQRTIPASTRLTLKAFPGFQGIASDLVQTKSHLEISAAIQYLLGSVLIVDNMDTALSVAHRLQNHYRIVTLDGDVINPGGAMTGGAHNVKSNSPLALNAEITALMKRQTQIEVALKTVTEKAAVLKTKISVQNQKINQLNTTLQQAQQSLSNAALSFQNQSKEVKRLKAAAELKAQQETAQKQELAKLQFKFEASQNHQSELAEKVKAQKQELADLQKQVTKFAQTAKTSQAELAACEAQLAVLTTQRLNSENAQKAKKHQATIIEKQLTDLMVKISHLKQTDLDSTTEKHHLKSTYEVSQKQKTIMQQELNQLNLQMGQLDAQLDQLNEIASRNYDLRKTAALSQEALSVKLAKLTAAIDQRLKKLRTDYTLTFEAALAKATIANTPQARADLQKQVKLHQMTIDDLGPINLQAISECEEVKKRYDFLAKQQADLLKARADIQKSMVSLDEEVKKRFLTTFNQIAASFAELFPQVFGGGKAKLALTAPDDLLTTGIEIIAQPPGKKLQRLSLFSGGERALMAITLLFAMLKANPVPFCILDEVEAALDDANVDRFARFLKRFELKTQFIVITHRRGTMKQADQLYGVVMPQAGVSQVISVSLKEIKEEVN